VLTAVILTQVTFGRSVKATLHYLVGTVSGTVYAGTVAVLIPHPNDVTLAGILALAVPPLALPGAIVPSFSAATLTGRVGAPVPRRLAVGCWRTQNGYMQIEGFASRQNRRPQALADCTQYGLTNDRLGYAENYTTLTDVTEVCPRKQAASRGTL
jgi:hypothetical protein